VQEEKSTNERYFIELVRKEIEKEKELDKLLLDGKGMMIGEISSLSLPKTSLKLFILFSGDFGVRIIDNLVNSLGHCTSCGHLCIDFRCKYGKYGFAENIEGILELPDPNTLPVVVDEPSKYLPDSIPSVDLVLATGIHNDLYLELPEILRRSDAKALIIFRDSPKDAPLGVVREIAEKCELYGIELATPKPSCLLRPDPSTPTINKFIKELRIGKPVIKLNLKELSGNIKVISEIEVYVSSPCGITWYVARQMLGYKFGDINDETLRKMYDDIALHHHSYPCTGSMDYDMEIGDTILHWGSYTDREAFVKALNLKEEFLKVVKERIRPKKKIVTDFMQFQTNARPFHKN
jgi:hypothetical protein